MNANTSPHPSAGTDQALRDILSNLTTRHERAALLEAHGAVSAAKAVLLANRVKEFQSADVVALARLILERLDRGADGAAR